MSSKDNMSLGDRMKEYYENCYKINLPRRIPLIIRLDGKAFHTLTRGCEKPFDKNIINLMDETAKYLCENIQGAQLAYLQSDEISILVHNYKRLESSAWFDNDLMKMCSVSASLATSKFNHVKAFNDIWNGECESSNMELFINTNLNDMKLAHFDSRAFVLPESEVCNYFIWRQKDWERNSIQMLAQSLYSHKELQNKKCSDLQEMCFQKGKNWNDLSIDLKRGRCIIRKSNLFNNDKAFRDLWEVDNNIPIFTEDREYINKLLKVEE